MTVTFRTNRNEVIKGALRIVGGYDPENTSGPTTHQLSLGAEALNLIVKKYGARRLQLWERRYAAIFPQKDQIVFKLGTPGPGGDHACECTPLGAGGFVQTTLSTAGSGTSVTVTSISSASTAGISAVSISNGYNIGIELDSGYLQWTTVSGSPSGTTVTLASALTGAASAGNTVYCYQTKLVRPLSISDGFLMNDDGTRTPCQVIPREFYNRFSQIPNSSGVPTQLYYDNQANSGYLYTYPTFSSVNQPVYIEWQKPIDDLTLATDDYDMPQEWGEVLKFDLALALSPEYEVPMEKFKQIQVLRKDSYDLVDSFDQEQDSVFLSPNTMLLQGR